MWGQLIYCLTLNKNKTENKSNNINIPANYLLFFFNVNLKKLILRLFTQLRIPMLLEQISQGTNMSSC